MTANRQDLLRDTRGAAIYIEFLVVVPLLSLLWVTATSMHRLGASQVVVQRQARQCAWTHAARGCQGTAPEACKLSGPSRLDAPELDRITGSDLEAAVRPVDGMAQLFRRTSGDEVVARPTLAVSTPFRDDASRAGSHRMMCNERPPALPQSKVTDLACRGLLGQGGRCP